MKNKAIYIGLGFALGVWVFPKLGIKLPGL